MRGIDGAGERRRHGDVHFDIELHRHAGPARRRAELGDQPARLEQRREDPVGELLHLRERPPRFALQLVEERLRRRGSSPPNRGDLEVGGEPHQVLLHALVQRPLDASTFGIGGQRESSPRGSELLDLVAQPIEGWLFLGLLGLQRLLPVPGTPGSCPSSVGRRQAASTVTDRMAASRRSPGRHRRAGLNDLLASGGRELIADRERRKTMKLGGMMRGTERRPQMKKPVLVWIAARSAGPSA